MIVRWLISISFYWLYYEMITTAFDKAFAFQLTTFGWILYIGILLFGLFYAFCYAIGLYEKKQK